MYHTTMTRRLRRRIFHRRSPVGAPPGTLGADPSAAPTQIRVIAYGPESVEEAVIADTAEVGAWRGRHQVLWVAVEGLGDQEAIGRLGEIFGLHRLALEDVLHVHQRAKVEPYSDHIFMVVRLVAMAERLETEQLSLFLGPGFVLSFHERASEQLDPVRQRVLEARGRIRRMGADYLAYALIDTGIDHYFPVLEAMGEHLEELENEVVRHTRADLLDRIHASRRDLLALRRALWPQREALNSLIRDTNPLVSDETRIYLRDAYDHTIQILDLLENYREIASAMMDVYLSSINNRMNEVMKTLTVVATIFIPLTFIAGVYGMNFDPDVSPWNMPELEWYWGYPAVLLFMAVAATGLLAWFRRRRWL